MLTGKQWVKMTSCRDSQQSLQRWRSERSRLVQHYFQTDVRVQDWHFLDAGLLKGSMLELVSCEDACKSSAPRRTSLQCSCARAETTLHAVIYYLNMCGPVRDTDPCSKRERRLRVESTPWRMLPIVGIARVAHLAWPVTGLVIDGPAK